MQEQLRDIHLPDPVSWWPLAPGWYGVLILLLLAGVLGWWLVKQWRQPSIKKLAARELQRIELAFSQHHNTQQLCSDISVLLRRAAISYKSRDNHAGITGKSWLAYLNRLCGQPLFDQQLAEYLLLAPYQKQSTAPAEKLINVVRQWIALLPTQAAFSRMEMEPVPDASSKKEPGAKSRQHKKTKKIKSAKSVTTS